MCQLPSNKPGEEEALIKLLQQKIKETFLVCWANKQKAGSPGWIKKMKSRLHNVTEQTNIG